MEPLLRYLVLVFLVAVATMIASPLPVSSSSRLAQGLARIPGLRSFDHRPLAKTGAALLAVQRDAALTTVPAADFQFQQDDLLVLAGNGRQIAEAVRVIGGDTQ